MSKPHPQAGRVESVKRLHERNNKAPLQFEVQREGQPYVDQPVFVKPRPIAAAIVAMFNPHYRLQPIMVGVERCRLRWG
ncbi:MAG: hypothetical protein KGP14_12390 [Betaproteobacteria bacterium]|nr:hypothetical protein [Betaproteobacteria bacterium]